MSVAHTSWEKPKKEVMHQQTLHEGRKMQKKSFAAISTALAAALMISTGSPAYAADAADGSKMTVQQMRQPIPLSLNKVSKVLGQPDVYVYDCNPEDIYEKSHCKSRLRNL